MHAVARGMQSVGNASRLRRFAAKIANGENVTVSVAGGSVSRGAGDAYSISSHFEGCVASPRSSVQVSLAASSPDCH